MKRLAGLPLRLHSALLAIIIVLVISGGIFVFYARVSTLMVERNTAHVNDVFGRVQASIEHIGVTSGRLLRTAAYNPAVQQYMAETDPLTRYELSTHIGPFLTQIIAFTDGIVDIAVRPLDGPPFGLGPAGHLIERTGRRFADGNRPVFSELILFASAGSIRPRRIVAVGMTAFSVLPGQRYGEPLGDIVLLLSADAIAAAIEPLGDATTRYFILDRAGNMLAGDREFLDRSDDLFAIARAADVELQTVLFDGRAYLVQSAAAPTLGGTVIGVTERAELLGAVRTLRSVMLVIMFAAVMIVAVPAALFVRNVSSPLVRLTSFVGRAKRIDPRKFHERIEPSGFAELRILTAEFNGMLDEIARLTDRLLEADARAYRSEILERDIELSVLQGQINPHFLYNTLETIRGMALAEAADDVAEVTLSLGRIYKYAVKTSDVVELRDELKMLESYLHIQKIRFGERIRSDFSVGTGASGFPVPKMMLQPIVENAVIHGIEGAAGGGQITIEASIHSDGGLSVTVRDTGLGMSEARLADVRRMLASGSRSRSGGSRGPIGLKNVRDRLVLLYGESARMSIDCVAGETVVNLRIPRLQGR
ncbi:MAG: hypothetical protein EA382_13860 [Spirochaetaceae bacterium]|nr:MAG: hypothetical protein EA382_13860 [Spirochaetaceae bacterium]